MSRPAETWGSPRYGFGVTGDVLDRLFQHCADLGVDVEWADLGPVRHGHYRPGVDTITLHILLTRRQTISCLAHELGHRAFGDTCSTPAGERRAWEYAGALLISAGDYERAEDLVGHRSADLAAELEVTARVIDGWRRWWVTRGQFLSEARSSLALD